ncbi:uncharacterized protein LOC131166218 [Malania oleifera]|uniref:uncharacterized protein LOC131166218 n=1 Tax=Malania oleifera TaxID=397392 RepID=UPI0025AEA942|nr:uncharacterized protein LOC131166218 [Malania oleifera]
MVFPIPKDCIIKEITSIFEGGKVYVSMPKKTITTTTTTITTTVGATTNTISQVIIDIGSEDKTKQINNLDATRATRTIARPINGDEDKTNEMNINSDATDTIARPINGDEDKTNEMNINSDATDTIATPINGGEDKTKDNIAAKADQLAPSPSTPSPATGNLPAPNSSPKDGAPSEMITENCAERGTKETKGRSGTNGKPTEFEKAPSAALQDGDRKVNGEKGKGSSANGVTMTQSKKNLERGDGSTSFPGGEDKTNEINNSGASEGRDTRDAEITGRAYSSAMSLFDVHGRDDRQLEANMGVAMLLAAAVGVLLTYCSTSSGRPRN